MQLGYSIILRELVAATEVDYGDCPQFQITCPACHEAVFKSGKLGGDRQFLSHYAASKSDVRECELRVAAISREVIAEKNIIGHGQSLELFFDKWRDFVTPWLFPENTDTIRKQINWMSSRSQFIELASYYQGVFYCSIEDNGGKIEAMLRRDFASVATPFWIERQIGFARDFMNHMVAINSLTGFTYLLAAVIKTSSHIGKEDRKILEQGNEKHLKRLIYDIFHRLRSQKGSILIAMARAMFYLVVAIPYIDFLGNTTNDTRNRDWFLRLDGLPLDDEFDNLTNITASMEPLPERWGGAQRS